MHKKFISHSFNFLLKEKNINKSNNYNDKTTYTLRKNIIFEIKRFDNTFLANLVSSQKR